MLRHKTISRISLRRAKFMEHNFLYLYARYIIQTCKRFGRTFARLLIVTIFTLIVAATGARIIILVHRGVPEFTKQILARILYLIPISANTRRIVTYSYVVVRPSRRMILLMRSNKCRVCARFGKFWTRYSASISERSISPRLLWRR